MTEVKFGTSGVRGPVAELTDSVCRAYCRAFLRHMAAVCDLKRGSAVLTGYDLRASSPRIASAICSEIAAQGFIAENCGQIPTPALAFSALQRAVPGIMITGSHIPDDRNGLKFYRPDGEINKEDEAAIVRLLNAAECAGSQMPAEADNAEAVAALPPENTAARQAYLLRALNLLPPNALSGLRIGIYQHSSVARDMLEEIITGLGAEAILLARSEKFIPVDTEALRAEDKDIARFAAATYGLDAVVSTDGDGDRPLIADESGVFFSGDTIGILTALFLRAECVVTPINSISILEKSGLFADIRRCRIGSPFVLEAMNGAKSAVAKTVIGFEANGGVLLGSDVLLPHGALLKALPTRDAVLPILCLLALAYRQGKPMSSLRYLLPPRFTAAGRLQNYPPAAAQQLLADLAQSDSARIMLSAFGEIAASNNLDGLRFHFIGGDVVHFRSSGNAPELRCYSEANNAERAAELLQMGFDIARKAQNVQGDIAR